MNIDMRPVPSGMTSPLQPVDVSWDKPVIQIILPKNMMNG